MGVNHRHMIRSTSPFMKLLRGFCLLWLSGMLLAPAAALALTAVPFAPVRAQLTNEIAVLEALPDPSSGDEARLRMLQRANKVFSKTSLGDGRALRLLRNKLRRLADYNEALDTVASNLVAVYNNEYEFVGLLIPELPPSAEANVAAARYAALAGKAARLNAEINARKTGSLYDPAKRRLDNVFFRANQALLIPFPADLPQNFVEAKIDNGSGPTHFQGSSSSASSDLIAFQAIRTGNTIQVLLSAVDANRGILFSIPDVQLGTFRYEIPSEATFTNRTDIDFFTVPVSSTDVGATGGSIFVSTTATEVFGSFECSGPGFTITEGRFRIDITEE